MNILGGILGKAIEPITNIIDKAIVDKDKKAQLKVDLQRAIIQAESEAEQRVHEQMIAQTEINKVEANHRSIFVAGWRPAAGWASVAGLTYATLLEPLFSWGARVVFDYEGPFPEIDPTLLIFVLGGMLGIGSLRTLEKVKGVSSDSVADNAAASRNVNILPPGFGDNPPEDAPWQK